MIVPGAPHQTRFLPQRFPCDAAMEMGVSIGIPPIAGWFIRENPMNIDDNWGYPHDLGNLQIYVWGFPGSDETEIPPRFSAQRPHPKREAASLFCNFNDMASVRNTTAEQISQNRLRWMAVNGAPFCEGGHTQVGGWYTYPSEKYESQLEWLFPIIWENNTCSKPFAGHHRIVLYSVLQG